ncbi:nuclear transport factor 2 family protein [Undibacterium jejuense]|uniref:Nuclear transport factor 2 family protein n=1 Tax=Undibacterium jejuense TaxID=1344949 RepID=A0A923HH05_9BURK|nr:nuclear transport factor 2 family protein [Undibacterium jejuense]MBC3862840.1 nuclear transport factor 2 family protein [Undibacterium jejuense]
MDHQTSLHNLVRFFETLTLAQSQDLSGVYTDDAYFKDPFNEVRGLPAVTHIFQHMFVQVEKPRFKITSTVLQGDTAFLCWDFYFYMKKFNPDEQCIRGATHIRFAADGRVQMHRDYWDAAEELYEKLPVLGSLMRMLKRMANK